MCRIITSPLTIIARGFLWSEIKISEDINYSFCQGTRQSPINILPEDIQYDPTLPELFITPGEVYI